MVLHTADGPDRAWNVGTFVFDDEHGSRVDHQHNRIATSTTTTTTTTTSSTTTTSTSSTTSTTTTTTTLP